MRKPDEMTVLTSEPSRLDFMIFSCVESTQNSLPRLQEGEGGGEGRGKGEGERREGSGGEGRVKGERGEGRGEWGEGEGRENVRDKEGRSIVLLQVTAQHRARAGDKINQPKEDVLSNSIHRIKMFRCIYTMCIKCTVTELH